MSRIGDAWRALFGIRAATRRPDWRELDLGQLFSLPAVDLEFPKARRLVAAVAKCSELIANDIAKLPVVFEEGEGEKWRALVRRPGNIVDVWMSANPMDTSFELARDLSENFNISGNSYLFLDGPNPKKPVALWSLHAHMVTPKVVRGRAVDHYAYERGTGSPVRLRPESVVHVRAFNSEDSPVGLSPLEGLRNQYETSYDLWRVLRRMTQAGGMASGYFKVPHHQGTPVAMNDAKKEAAVKKLQQHFGGIENVGKPMILDVLEWVQAGLSVDQLKAVELSTLTEYDIAARYHIPPSRLGLPDRSAGGGLNGTGTNSSERDYWESCIMPQVALRDAVLNERFCRLFSESYRIRTDFSRVIALQAPLLQQAQGMTTLAGRPVLTVNEVRSRMGIPLSADPTADELHVPAGPLGLGDGADEEPVGKPEPGDEDANTKDQKSRRMIEGDESRERARGRAKADVRRYERRVAEQFRGIFDAQEARVVAALEAQGSRALDGIRGKTLNIEGDPDIATRAMVARAISPDDLLTPDPEDENAIARILADLIRARGEAAAAEIALELELNMANARIAGFIRANAQRVLVLTTETTREALRTSLAQGVSLSEGLSELVARVHAVFDGRRGNAATIARTETISAYNFASAEAYAESGIVEGMEWLTARDGAVRESHSVADGQVAKLGATFEVGGSALAFPGDPAGPPGETINCRCTTLPVLVEEKRRAPSASDWFKANPNGTALRRNRIKELIP